MNKKSLALAALAGLCIVLIVFGSRFLMQKNYKGEKIRLSEDALLTVHACAQHTSQILHQVDVIIHAVRMTYYRDRSVSETEQFIKGLNFDSSIIEDIFLTRSDGTFSIPLNESTRLLDISDRDYFAYHRAAIDDALFISSVEKGRITQKYRFRISRKITNADGSFGGVLIVTINPESFTRYYQELSIEGLGLASLLGTSDQKLRARTPEPAEDKWNVPLENPELWSALEKSDLGSFEVISPVDAIKRIFVYKKIESLPLVMLVGFSEADLQSRVSGRNNWILLIATIAIVFLLMITTVLIAVIISREKLKVVNKSLNSLYSQLQELALFDRLTGLPTRVLFSDRLQNTLLAAERNGEHCVLLFLDLDGFKLVNDTYGHDAGDAVLKIVANRMQSVLRKTDTVCRWGGDEFLILLPTMRNRKKVAAISEELLHAVKIPIDYNGNICTVSASVGVAGFPENGRTADVLQKAADTAMYQAKKQGKDNVVFA